MGAPWAEHESWELVEEASAIAGRDLADLLLNADAAELQQTRSSQIVTFINSLVVLDAVERLGVSPSAAAGHSLGEYTALVAAGAMRFEDAVPLVRLRAQAMQEAVPEGTGGIAAILGLDDALLGEVLAAAAQGQVVEAANLNSPGQVVIAGHRAAVERGMALAKEKGAKRAVMLPMSAPSHCSLMRPAAERLRERLEAITISRPTVPVVHNRSVEAYDDPARIRTALVEQLDHPVRWIETVQFLAGHGVKRLVECAPGKVLVGLSKRIAGELDAVAVTDSASLAAAVEGSC